MGVAKLSELPPWCGEMEGPPICADCEGVIVAEFVVYYNGGIGRDGVALFCHDCASHLALVLLSDGITAERMNLDPNASAFGHSNVFDAEAYRVKEVEWEERMAAEWERICGRDDAQLRPQQEKTYTLAQLRGAWFAGASAVREGRA